MSQPSDGPVAERLVEAKAAACEAARILTGFVSDGYRSGEDYRRLLRASDDLGAALEWVETLLMDEGNR